MTNISIIVPTYNSERTIEQCLKAISESDYNDYELIVSDCGSDDSTVLIASKYADKVLKLQKNSNRCQARDSGVKAASGHIIVNIDSDVLIKPDTLNRISDYFSKHQEIDALTGLLSKEHPNSNFFSQYKNLYMHYIFSRLPEKVTFLYGSIYALRREAAWYYDSDIKIVDDTELGQKLVSDGKQIAFLNNLEVIHLKRYNLLSFFKNDFQIPFDWARIFINYKGWQQLGKNKIGYIHSPKEQLISIILAPTIVILLFMWFFGYPFLPVATISISIWAIFNFRFFTFLLKEKGIIFVTAAIVVIFLDNIVMAFGILCGFIYSLCRK